MDEKILQEKLVEVQQQLIQMKTEQWGQNDSWMPYYAEWSTSITPSESGVIPQKYFEIEWISPVLEPSLRIPYVYDGMTFFCPCEFGDDFTNTYYYANSTFRASGSESRMIRFFIFSSQPGVLKGTEITEQEYNENRKMNFVVMTNT